jgi:hypothetical protein
MNIKQMQFSNDLINFLGKNGTIYTVRKYKMDEQSVKVKTVGTCKRIPVGIIRLKLDLARYVLYSGFRNIDEWWNRITRYINPELDIMYIYKVVVTYSMKGNNSEKY